MAAPRPGSRAHAAAVVRLLAEAYGPRPWRRHHAPVDELVTTILSQNTSDVNQHRAFASLRGRFPAWDAVRAAPTADVVEAIRSGGLAEIKGPRIQRVLEAIAGEPRGADLEWLGETPLDEAMAYLTALPGVGPKTAACVMCFSFRRPVLPVDTHVHRSALRLGMVPPGTGAAATQVALTRLVAPDEIYGTHVRLVAHGRALCRAQRPLCEECPLLSLCPDGKARLRGRRSERPRGPQAVRESRP